MTNKMYPTMKEYLRAEYQGPWSATDIIIRHNDGKKEGIVLIDRKYMPYGYAIPGGIAENMTYTANALKEAAEETGLIVKIDKPYYRPFATLSFPTQDPRAFISSHAYTAEGEGVLNPDPGEDANSAVVLTLEEIANLLEKPVWKKEDISKDVIAFVSHKYLLAIYLKEKCATLNGRQTQTVDKLYCEYMAREEKFLEEQRKELEQRYALKRARG